MSNAITVTTQHSNVGDYSLVSRNATDERLVDMWLASGKRAESPLTQASYRRTWRSFSACVGKPLQAITLEDLQLWRSQLTGKNSTQKTKIAAIKSLFGFAVKVGYLRMSPAVMVESPPVPKKAHKSRIIAKEDIKSMLDACQTDREYALIRCLYSSGARISEVLSLQWQDVAPRQNGKGTAGLLYIRKAKGGESKDRETDINIATYNALLRLRDEDTPEDAYVFATRTGKAMDRQSAHKIVKRVLRRAGLPDNASCHWFRHSCATFLLQAGANVADVMEQLGHASLATTSIYVEKTSFPSDLLD